MSRLQSSQPYRNTPNQPGDFFRSPTQSAIGAFKEFIQEQDFPCVAAKSALATRGMRFVVAGDLRTRQADRTILTGLTAPPTRAEQKSEFVSTAVLFPRTPLLSELAFEQHLWALLQSLYELDRDQSGWDSMASPDPRSPDFGMSLGGTAYFVIGMHPGSSRLARQTPVAAAVFNPHSQFRRLRKNDMFDRMREAIREREIALQGDANPMLADHGEISEAAQYSGRQVSPDWACPFRPRTVD